MIALALVGLLGLQAGGENRLWWAELELTGPLAGVSVEVGADGATRLTLGLLAGESRTLTVPLPVRSPLGERALSSLPAPTLRVEGGGRAVFRGWSADQPAAGIERLPFALRERPRPPLRDAEPRAAVGELVLLAAALVMTLGLRRRPRAALLLGLFAASALGTRVARRPVAGRPVVLIELDAESGRGLTVRGGRGEVALARGRLEASPAHVRLELELVLSGDRIQGVVRAPGVDLHTLVVEAHGSLLPGANDLEDLEATWVRSSGGAWTVHGAWRRGNALPPALVSGHASDPPGWLRAGLPPGRAVVLGRLAGPDEVWVRGAGP